MNQLFVVGIFLKPFPTICQVNVTFGVPSSNIGLQWTMLSVQMTIVVWCLCGDVPLRKRSPQGKCSVDVIMESMEFVRHFCDLGGSLWPHQRWWLIIKAKIIPKWLKMSVICSLVNHYDSWDLSWSMCSFVVGDCWNHLPGGSPGSNIYMMSLVGKVG